MSCWGLSTNTQVSAKTKCGVRGVGRNAEWDRAWVSVWKACVPGSVSTHPCLVVMTLYPLNSLEPLSMLTPAAPREAMRSTLFSMRCLPRFPVLTLAPMARKQRHVHELLQEVAPVYSGGHHVSHHLAGSMLHLKKICWWSNTDYLFFFSVLTALYLQNSEKCPQVVSITYKTDHVHSGLCESWTWPLY